MSTRPREWKCILPPNAFSAADEAFPLLAAIVSQQVFFVRAAQIIRGSGAGSAPKLKPPQILQVLMHEFLTLFVSFVRQLFGLKMMFDIWH